MNRRNLMVLVLTVSLVIGVALVGGCTASKIATLERPAQIIEDVSPREASTLIQNNQNNPDFVILDVRTRQEFTDGHIKNATNIDFYSQTFRDELNKLDKNKPYLIYCQSGNRSGKARDIMGELEFQEVYNVSGGIIAWNAEGLPTTK